MRGRERHSGRTTPPDGLATAWVTLVLHYGLGLLALTLIQGLYFFGHVTG